MRPVSVSFAGKTTTYVYGADGARLKKVESDPVNGSSVTLYIGPVEIRKYGVAAEEEILLYPQPNIRITKTKSGSTVTTKVNTLHLDGLGSVRAVTDGAGAVVERTNYRPYGEEVAGVPGALGLSETKGFIGERYDAGAGLQYLNARYYDPRLGMFLQPDWWEVTKPGVGTNRYAYSFGDPVNGRDPGGHEKIVEGEFDAEEEDEIREAAAKGRKQLEDSIEAYSSLLDELQEGEVKSKKNKKTLKNYQNSYGVDRATPEQIEKMIEDLRQVREWLGDPEFGVRIVNGGVDWNNAAAMGVRPLGSTDPVEVMEVRSSFFTGFKPGGKAGFLIHELGHGVLGLTDKIPVVRNGQVELKSEYGRLGISRAISASRTINDMFVCAAIGRC